MDASHTVADTAISAAAAERVAETITRAVDPRDLARPGRGHRWWGGVPWSGTDRLIRSRRNRADRKYRRQEIRTIWRQVAQDTGLAHRIFSPSGVMWAAPDLSAIDTGVDEAFTVHLRTGQTWDQVRGACPRIATAFGVPAVRLVELTPDWVRIELLHDYERAEPAELADAVPAGPGTSPPALVEPSVPGWAVAIHAMVDVRISPGTT
jgi:hypothetical protein